MSPGPLGWYVPRGRIPRRTWWLQYVLMIALLGVVAGAVDATFFPGSPVRFEDLPGQVDLADLLWVFPSSGGPVTAVVAFLALVPTVAATVARLHDRDHSAWWLLWFLLAGIGWVVLFVTAGLLGTRPYPNRFGPPPR